MKSDIDSHTLVKEFSLCENINNLINLIEINNEKSLLLQNKLSSFGSKLRVRYNTNRLKTIAISLARYIDNSVPQEVL